MIQSENIQGLVEQYMLYRISKKIVSLFFNLLNVLMKGNLPPFGCACVIVERDGYYLVVDQGKRVVFPGGFIRWHEHPVQTAMREGHEETGLFLEIGDIVNVYPGITNSMDDMSTLTVVYEGKAIGGTLQDTGEGKPYWIDEKTLREQFGSYYGGMLDDYLTYHRRQEQIKTAQEVQTVEEIKIVQEVKEGQKVGVSRL